MKNALRRRTTFTAKRKRSSRALGLAQPLDNEFGSFLGVTTFDLPSSDIPSEPEVEEAWDHFQHECYGLYPLNRR